MKDFEYTLERLALAFVVKDIMVPRKKLVCASDQPLARTLLKENPGFDVIPIDQNGIISSYIRRGEENAESIFLVDLISDSTSIIDLVDILLDREFRFILSNNNISGYVHFSDLNNQIVKIPFYVLFEATERHLLQQIGPHINEDNLDSVLSGKRLQTVINKINKMKKNRADFGLVPQLYFSEILKLALKLDIANFNENDVDDLSKVRNLVAHADKALVEGHRDIRRLSRTKNICFSILRDM